MFETIIKREDGSQVKIKITPFIDTFLKKIRWGNWYVMRLGKGKRKWENVVDQYSNDFYHTAKEVIKNKYLEVVTPDEVNAAMLAAWEQLKPELIQPQKFAGCTVEHKHTGTMAICTDEMIADSDWLFLSEKQIQF